MRYLAILVASLVTSAMGGCGERNVPWTSTEALSGPSFNFLNGPENPGNSGVFRFQDVFFVASTDPDRDLLALHFQADDLLRCGGSSDFEISDVQFVNNMDDVIRVLSQLKDAPILIYRLSDTPLPPPPIPCEHLQENWLYRGTHSLLLHDNNLLVSGPGANSFGWSAHGTVYDPSGTRCQYSENQNALISPDGEFLGFRNENIRVACRER